jgi:hypothetical protein
VAVKNYLISGIVQIVIGLVCLGASALTYWITHRFPPTDKWWILFVTVPLIWAVATLALGSKDLLRYHSQSQISGGIDATAAVLSVSQTGTYFNKQPEVTLQLEVRPSTGEPFVSSTTAVLSYPTLAAVSQRGAVVSVRYDPTTRKVVLR